jgi:hypothetical protein
MHSYQVPISKFLAMTVTSVAHIKGFLLKIAYHCHEALTKNETPLSHTLGCSISSFDNALPF